MIKKFGMKLNKILLHENLAQTWMFENEINMDYGKVGWLCNIGVDSENKFNMDIWFPFIQNSLDNLLHYCNM